MPKSKQVDLLKVAAEKQAEDVSQAVGSEAKTSDDAVFPEAFAASGPNTTMVTNSVSVTKDS